MEQMNHVQTWQSEVEESPLGSPVLLQAPPRHSLPVGFAQLCPSLMALPPFLSSNLAPVPFFPTGFCFSESLYQGQWVSHQLHAVCGDPVTAQGVLSTSERLSKPMCCLFWGRHVVGWIPVVQQLVTVPGGAWGHLSA